MIYRIEITNKIAKGLVIAHHFEQIVDDAEEAQQFGSHCAFLMQAYNVGFGEADLSE